MLRVHLGVAESHVPKEQAVLKISNVKVAGLSATVDEVVDHCKRQAVSTFSIRESSAERTEMKARLATTTVEKPALPEQLGTA